MISFPKKILAIIIVLCVLVPSVAVSAEQADVSPNVAVAGQGTTSAASTTTGETTDGAAKTSTAATTTGETTGGAAKTSTAATTTGETTGGAAKASKVSYSTMKTGIANMQAKNSDVKAWLNVPNTNINFPIVKPADNFYYVNRTVEGVDHPNNNYKNYKTTATYTDSRVKLGTSWKNSSKNIVIYGHNWTNLRAPYAIGNYSQHVMFGQLPSYMSMDFTKANPYIYFSTENMSGTWKIFSVALIEEDHTIFGYNTPNPGTEMFGKMLKEFRDRSIYDFSTDVTTSDRIITLDTCIRHYSNVGPAQRFVVVARLLREGETDGDAINIVKNADVKTPKF